MTASEQFYNFRVAEVSDLQGNPMPWLTRGSSQMRQLEKQPTFLRWLTPVYTSRNSPSVMIQYGCFLEWPSINGTDLVWASSNQAALETGAPWAPAYMEAFGYGSRRNLTPTDEEAGVETLLTNASLPPWDDSDVQVVYNLLESEEVPPLEQHWEGWVARRIMRALRLLHPKTEVLVQQMIETHRKTWWVRLIRGKQTIDIRQYAEHHKNRADYEGAELKHFLGQGAKPNIGDYNDPEPTQEDNQS